jgi:hypothetical protein
VCDIKVTLNAKYLRFGSARRVARDAGTDVNCCNCVEPGIYLQYATLFFTDLNLLICSLVDRNAIDGAVLVI